ncbi:protein Rer1p [[Candida] anglica]|uniref:Protein RER1 n=1 Tax=[Candida] anglica TaxID=148631 RepID=A0ABP0EIV4_9ASCO
MAFDLKDLQSNPVYQKYHELEVTYQKYLDRSVPHATHRWIAFGALFAVFFLRILLAQGWYIICYGLGIYLLNLFLAFLTPKFDPSLEQEMKNESIEEGLEGGAEAEGSSSASAERSDQEFRPFIRRLPEFKFWYNATRATAISLLMSMFVIFDIPVFWPILVMYFVVLFTLTMRKQVQHMVKYRYLPFDFGKAKYKPSH